MEAGELTTSSSSSGTRSTGTNRTTGREGIDQAAAWKEIELDCGTADRKERRARSLYIGGKTQSEIANIMDIGVRTVRRLIHRGGRVEARHRARIPSPVTRAKLTPAKVRAIRRAADTSAEVLAQRHGISSRQVRRIWSGEAWEGV